MPRNYYLILGVNAESSQQEIKDAYRRLAKEYHPDHFGPNITPFQLIQEAYSVLGNPACRVAYDENLSAHRQRREHAPTRRRPAPHVEPMTADAFSLSRGGGATPQRQRFRFPFDQVFDELLTNFQESPSPTYRFRSSMTFEVPLTQLQAMVGGNLEVYIPVQSRCPSCDSYDVATTYSCWRCDGTGFLLGQQPILISFPPGIAERHAVTIATNVDEGRQLYLTVVFRVYP